MHDFDWTILRELYMMPNITKVAGRLYISQPSLTKRIQSIEDEFHVKILVRTTKGVQFTPEGELLVEKARLYDEFLQRTRKEIREMQNLSKKSITLGASYTYSKFVLPEMLSQYTQEHHEVVFEVENEQSNVLFRKVCEDKLDAAIVRGDYEGDVEKIKLNERPAYIISKYPIEMENIPNLTQIQYKTNDRSKEKLDRWWEEHFSKEPNNKMRVGYVDVAWQMVAKDFGYVCCFLPENFQNTYNLTLTPMRYLAGSQVTRNTWLVYNRKKQSEQLKEFVRYITSHTECES